MTDNITVQNPFVGLRPFESGDSLYYFGRKQQTRALLKQLHANRFVAVVGSSGCGKSSLVRAGLIPNLEAGFMVQDRDLWKIAIFKPGDSPLRNLAAAMVSAGGVPGTAEATPALLERMRRQGSQALVQQARSIPDGDENNLLIVVDQFEELFRFQQDRTTQVREEAADFVASLLNLAAQKETPIYVVLTMRSDFLGHCDAFQGLPEAMNNSQYLVPRLTRQQRREAIMGPIRLAAANMTPRLLDRLLNEALDTRDDLPVLQHVLMRTWNVWAQDGKGPIDLEHYEKTGTIQQALSIHADEALTGLDEESLKIARRMFQALTETDAANRRIRRPAHLHQLAAVCGKRVAPETIMALIQRFNAEDRNFLVLSSPNAQDDPLIDISHESLIRQWKTLSAWVDEDAESARIYKRLAESAELHAGGKAGLYREADLLVALDWQRQQQPVADWAARYHPKFELAIGFLERSVRKQKTNRSFVASLLVCVYGCVCSWLLVANSDHVSLATNSISLPVVGRMPAEQIYAVVPLLLGSIYAYFLFYLQRLMLMLSHRTAESSDGRSSLNRLEGVGMYALAWFTVPAALLGLWVKYLLRRDWSVTGLHIFFITLVFGLAVIFHRSVKRGRSNELRTLWQYVKPVVAASVLLIAAVFWSLSFGAFNGTPTYKYRLLREVEKLEKDLSSAPSEQHPTVLDKLRKARAERTARLDDLGEFQIHGIRLLVPRIFDKLGYDLFFDLKEKFVSELPDDYWLIASESDRLNAVRGAFLKKADLRYADMFRAFLVNAILRNSYLRGARLRQANLQRADIRGADMKGVDLRGADLREADLREALLQRADLFDADLRNAQLGMADLRGASLKNARLEGADLRCARLMGVRDLDPKSLFSVSSLYRAELEEVNAAELKMAKPQLFENPPLWHDMTMPHTEKKKDICE
jgi:energy-coupling factor transporter ATP-binding protein EcfA2